MHFFGQKSTVKFLTRIIYPAQREHCHCLKRISILIILKSTVVPKRTIGSSKESGDVMRTRIAMEFKRARIILDKGSTSQICYRYGCTTHHARKCTTPKHLVTLYQQSIGKGEKARGNQYEAHFTGPMIESSQGFH